jgi:hypothetical protein
VRTVLADDGGWSRVEDECGCAATTEKVWQCAEHELKDDTDPDHYVTRYRMLLKAAADAREQHNRGWLRHAVIKEHEDSR